LRGQEGAIGMTKAEGAAGDRGDRGAVLEAASNKAFAVPKGCSSVPNGSS